MYRLKYAWCVYIFYSVIKRLYVFIENVKIEEKIKTSDDGKGILITNDAIEQISALLKNQTDKKALRVGVRSGGCSGMSYTMDFIGGDEINSDDKVYDYSLSSEQTFKVICLSLIHIWRCRRLLTCRSRWSPYH